MSRKKQNKIINKNLKRKRKVIHQITNNQKKSVNRQLKCDKSDNKQSSSAAKVYVNLLARFGTLNKTIKTNIQKAQSKQIKAYEKRKPKGYKSFNINVGDKVLKRNLRKMSLLMRKPTICICENKDADQLRGNREADQRLCFRYSDSI